MTTGRKAHPFTCSLLAGVFASLIGGCWSIAQAEDTTDKALHDMLPERVKQSGVIKIGSPQTIPPQVFLKDQKLVGVAVDVSRAVEPILGVKFDWEDMQWPGIIPGLQSGTIDASWGIMGYLPERTKFLNIIPFVKDEAGLIVQPGATGFSSSTSSLCGQKVGGLQGTNYATYTEAESKKCVSAGKPPIDQHIYSSSGAALVAFQAGNVDGFITSYIEALDINKKSGGKYKTFAIDAWPSPPESIATAKDEWALAQAIAGAMKILQDNGSYKKILASYDIADVALPASETVIDPAGYSKKQ